MTSMNRIRNLAVLPINVIISLIIGLPLVMIYLASGAIFSVCESLLQILDDALYAMEAWKNK